MSDCTHCEIEEECYYPYKPCDCVHQRKFWSKDEREQWDDEENLTGYKEYCGRCEFTGRNPVPYAQYLVYKKEYDKTYNTLWLHSGMNWPEIIRIEENLCI